MYKRNGYTQTGWSLTDGGGKAYDLGGTYSVDAALTLFPFWEINHTVTYLYGYYPPEGKTKESVYGTDIKYPGKELSIGRYAGVGNRRSIDTAVDDDGHRFRCRGWAKNIDSETADYTTGDKYTLDEDMTLYPAWQRYYYVEYKRGNYSVETKSLETQLRKYYGTSDATITLYSSNASYLYTDSRGTHYHDGWSKDPDGTTKDFGFGYYYSDDEDQTLYPYWESYVNITYDPGEEGISTAEGGVVVEQKKKNSSAYIKNAIFTRPGYTQVGWNTTESASSSSYDFGSYYYSDNDITLYPVWKEKHTITYMPGDLEGASEVTDTKSYGTAATIRGDVFNNRKASLLGWKTDPDGEDIDYKEGDTYSTEADLTLYPVWKAKTYALWIGDTQVDMVNADDIFGDGTASFDARTSTLTLNGLSVTKYKSFFREGTNGTYNAGIAALGVTKLPHEADVYAEATEVVADKAIEELQIVCKGENTIDPAFLPDENAILVDCGIYTDETSIKLSGSGSLKIGNSDASANKTAYGIHCKGSYLGYLDSMPVFEMTGLTLDIYAINAGIFSTFSYSDGIVIDDGNLTVTVQGPGAVGLYSEVDSKAVLIKGGNIKIYSLADKVTTEGQDMVPILIYAHSEDSTAVQMRGGNLLLENKGNAGVGVYAYVGYPGGEGGDFLGTGEENADGVPSYDPGEPGELQDEILYGLDYLAGDVTIVSATASIYTSPENALFKNLHISDTANVLAGPSASTAKKVTDIEALLSAGPEASRYVAIGGGTLPAETYMTLCGAPVNDDNLSGEGWSYDPATRTLTLTDYEGSYDGENGISSEGDLNIVLEGNSSLGVYPDTPEYGIFTEGSLNISGTGFLDLAAARTGILSYGPITFDGGAVDVYAGYGNDGEATIDDIPSETGIRSISRVVVNDGNINVITSAATAVLSSELRESGFEDIGIEANRFVMNSGTVGVTCALTGIEVDNFEQNDGSITINATGGKNPATQNGDTKGISARKTVRINGGSLDADSYLCGISCGEYEQSDGEVTVRSLYDEQNIPTYAEAIYTGQSSYELGDLTVTGGRLYCEAKYIAIKLDEQSGFSLTQRGGLIKAVSRMKSLSGYNTPVILYPAVDIYGGRMELTGVDYGIRKYKGGSSEVNYRGGSLLIQGCAEHRYPVYGNLYARLSFFGQRNEEGGELSIRTGGQTVYCSSLKYLELTTVNAVSYRPGENGTGEAVNTAKLGGAPLKLLGAVYTRDGFVQTGWAESDGGAKAYDLETEYTRDESTVLYPVWQASKMISYKPGTAQETEEYEDLVPLNGQIKLRGNIYTKTSGVQRGWNTSSDGSGQSYEAGALLTVSSDMILYPVFDETLALTYDKGMRGSGDVFTERHNVGAAFNLRNAIYTRNGFEQKGWSLTDGGEKVYELGEEVTLTEDTLLYPFWEKLKQEEPGPGPGSSSTGNTTSSSGKTTTSSGKTTSSSGKGSTSSSSSGSGSSSSAPAPAAEPLTGPLKLTDIKSAVTGEDGKAVLDSVEAVSYVTYNGKKHTVPALAKSSKVTGDIEVKVSGDILKYATVAYKFKNNKEVSEKKQHYFTISFKPIKGVTTPAQKKVIKALNKDVKKKRATFDIRPASLSGAKIVKKKFNKKKTKLTALSVTIGGNTFKLGKKNYTPNVTEKGIEIKGKGNFKDTLLVPFE